MGDQAEDYYAGREHSRIKHQFLTEYISAAAYKTFQGRSPIFNYVDGFAGPWSVTDDQSLSDSSFDRSIKALQTVKATLQAQIKKQFTVRFCLCEREPDRVRRLRLYAQAHPSLDIHVFEGPFEANLDSIAAVCDRGFTFTFIDPTGFNLGSMEIARFLARQDGEFLLNFMSEHINRYPSVESVRRAFGRLLADTDWKTRFDALPSYLRNEERILVLLKEQLKALKAAHYLPDFEIMNARAERLQMRLVLGTNHPTGVEVFRGVQAKVEKAQSEMRDNLRNPGQASLFAMDVPDGVGSRLACDAARRTIVEMLTPGSPLLLRDLIGPVLESAAVRKTHLTSILLDMRTAGAVQFVLGKRQRKPDDATLISKGGTDDLR